MIFQQFNLVPRLDVLTNVLVGRLNRIPTTRAMLKLFTPTERALATGALDRLGIADLALTRADTLSGGQQQRVAIARALITDPTLIVADEPTGDLDRTTAEEVLGLLERLNAELGKTIIMVTHDPKAASHARKIVQLEKGVLVG
jgi:ABC-type phosphate/phosphonate transport system ATPase subunit